MENINEYEEISTNEKKVIENKIYYIKGLQYFYIKFYNFNGALNLISLNQKKNYKFFYPILIKEDFFIFEQKDSFLFYFNNNQNNAEFMIIPENYQNTFIKQDELFLRDNYNQFIISYDLIHLKNRIKESYGIDYYQNNNDNILFFGLYNYLDLELLINFSKNTEKKIGILWGGSDIMLKTELRDILINIIIERNCENYAMSDYIWNKLEILGVKNKKKVCISFCWNDWKYLKKIDNKAQQIFIYDGMGQNYRKNEIYNRKLIDEFISLLPVSFSNKIYRTSNNNFTNNIHEIQANSFVSLRLTNYDGNANSAQECGMMGIPVISNQNMNHCISWENIYEILKKVDFIWKNNIRIFWKKGGVNLLFISNDNIGKGGGATFTFELKKYLENRGFNIWIIYLIHDNYNNNIIINDDQIIQIYLNTRNKWNLLEKIQNIHDDNFQNFIKKNYTIILRSYIPIKNLYDLQTINTKIIFFIPGIFKNSLDKNWNNMKDGEILKNLNLLNFKIANRLLSYCNSYLTQTIYQKYGISTVGLLEINLLKIQKSCKKWDDSQRDIDYLFVVSEINRQIKNVRLFYELSEILPGKFCIISNDKVQERLSSNIEYIDGLNYDELEKYYLRSKILISPSFFDSMSNTVLEAINCGCFVLVSVNHGVYLSEEHIINNYEIESWEKKCLEVIEMWKEDIEKIEKIRKKTKQSLLEKSWEVEIRLLEILSKN
jgi:hypothetical protein